VQKQVLHETMSGDINSLGHQLNRFSERNRHFRDFTLYSLISTLKEVIASFPVYRTYITQDDPVTDHDRLYIAEAVRSARSRAPAVSPLMFDFVERLLLKRTTVTAPEECQERARFIGKLQQITSPVMAKGTEDTAMYIYNRLLSLNEVGADPTQLGLEPARCTTGLERQRQSPSRFGNLHATPARRDADAPERAVGDTRRVGNARWRAVNRRFKTEIRRRLRLTPTRNT
jgi:(1->4)-alpha-D-glucan 1-alpha-D-glucosylmutase